MVHTRPIATANFQQLTPYRLSQSAMLNTAKHSTRQIEIFKSIRDFVLPSAKCFGVVSTATNSHNETEINRTKIVQPAEKQEIGQKVPSPLHTHTHTH